MLLFANKCMILLCTLVLHFTVVLSVDLQEDILCTAAFCEQERENGNCKDNIPEGCSYKGLMIDSPTPCHCCKYCIGYLDEKDSCDKGSPTSETVQKICGPGLTCEDGKCVQMTNTPCKKKQKNYDVNGNFGDFSWRPVCDNEGNYGAVHCMANSICYCIEPSKGERIFGEALFSSEVAQSMTCSCSMASLNAKLLGGGEFFRCLPDGSYDELQCINNECMCVDSVTGIPTGNSRVHATALKQGALPCFNKEIHPEGIFEKSCERDYKTKINELKAWESEGIVGLYIHLPNCTEDGYYNRTQMEENVFKCVDRNGNQIKTYESNSETDCHCAYTAWLMQEAGLRELPSCNNDGSFRKRQCLGDKCYCVDKYGNQNSKHVSFTDELNCP